MLTNEEITEIQIVCANNLTGEYSLLDPSTFDLPSLSSSIPVKQIGGVNQAAGAVCGGRSRVEKIWRVEREKERVSGASGLGFRREYAEFILYPNS
ncbi:unnamed protein product [Prunus armeniaca]